MQFERRLYQIPPGIRHRPAPGINVVVRKWLDSSIHWHWKDRPLDVREIQLPKAKKAPTPLSGLLEVTFLKSRKVGTFLTSLDRILSEAGCP